MLDEEKYLEEKSYKTVVPASLDRLTSPTSHSVSCFVYQFHSKRLQRFMIDYTLKVTANSPTKE